MAKTEATFRLWIDGFSDFAHENRDRISPPEILRGLPWNILATSEYAPNQRRPTLGFFVQCNAASDSKTWSCFAQISLRIVGQKDGVSNYEKELFHTFHCHENNHGFPHFITFMTLLHPESGYIKHDTVILEVFIRAEAPYGIKENHNNKDVVSQLKNYEDPFNFCALKRTLMQSMDIFACKICLGTMKPPVFLCLHCHQLIGCGICISEILTSSRNRCPCCRHDWAEDGVHEVKGLDDFLAQLNCYDQ